MNRKGDKVQPTPKPNVVGGTMTSKNPTTTKCHPKTLDIPVTTSASIMSSAKKMIFANGNGDKRSSVGNAMASHNRTTSSQSPRRGGRGGQQNKQQNQNQNQAHQQQTQKISPVSANSASSSSATSSSSSSGSSSGAINPSQLASICREVALIRDEHVAIRNTLSEKDGELGKTRVALRNLAEERDLLRNKVSELEQILKHSPQMYSHVASMISNGSGAVRNQNHPMIMSTMVASSSTSSPIPEGRHQGCGNNMNNNNNNNHSSIERQSSTSTSTSTSAAVIIPNNNHIPPELGNCVRNNKGNNGAPPPQQQQQQQNQKSGSVSGNNNGGLVVHPSKHDGGGMEEMVGNPVTLSSPPPPNINSQEAHQANNNSKKVGEREQQQHSMQQQQQGYVKNSSSSHHHPPPYQYEQPGKMGQVALSSPPFQQQDLLENGNGRNNENGNGMLPATIMTGCNNNNNQFKNVGTYGGGGGGVGGVGENLRHHHHQQHHHLSQSGITGLDLMLLGPDCSTKVVEHLVHPWAIESSVREIEHRLVLKGVPLDGERVREVEIEIDRLNSRIDHLRSQNDVLTLNLEDAKSHADRLTVLLGKYESNNVALQLALRYSDQMSDAYEVLVALLETEMGQVLANLHARGHLSAICPPPSPSNNNTSGGESTTCTSGVVVAVVPSRNNSGNNNNSNDNSPSEQVPPEPVTVEVVEGGTTTKESGKGDGGQTTEDKLSPSSPSSSGVSCSPSPKSVNLMEQAKRNRLVAERAARFLLSRFGPSSTYGIQQYSTFHHNQVGSFQSSQANFNPFLSQDHQHQHNRNNSMSGSTGTTPTGSMLSSSPSAASNISGESGGAGGRSSHQGSPTSSQPSAGQKKKKDGCGGESGTTGMAEVTTTTTMMMMMTTSRSSGGASPTTTTTTSSTFRAPSCSSPFSPNGNEHAVGGDNSSVIPTLLPLLTTGTGPSGGTTTAGNVIPVAPSGSSPSSSTVPASVEPLIRNLISTLKAERDGVKQTVITELESESLESLTPSPKPFDSNPYYNNSQRNNYSSMTTAAPPTAWSPAECRKLDLETAVLMQELMAMKEERAELRAQLFLLEKEKDSLELRVRSHESQEEAYMARINYLKSEIMDCKTLYSTPGMTTMDTYHPADNRNRNEMIINSQQPHQQKKNGNNRNLETALINNNNNNQNGNWEREALLKKRIHELASTLERVTVGSHAREKENEEMINELNRANGILMQTLEVAKKKYQGRIKKMEDQILYVSERHAAQMKLFGEGGGSRTRLQGGGGNKYH